MDFQFLKVWNGSWNESKLNVSLYHSKHSIVTEICILSSSWPIAYTECEYISMDDFQGFKHSSKIYRPYGANMVAKILSKNKITSIQDISKPLFCHGRHRLATCSYDWLHFDRYPGKSMAVFARICRPVNRSFTSAFSSHTFQMLEPKQKAELQSFLWMIMFQTTVSRKMN